MLSRVMMADPRPRPAQVADVVRAALAARLRQAWSGVGAWGRGPRRASAASSSTT
jgi:hypothetical protein